MAAKDLKVSKNVYKVTGNFKKNKKFQKFSKEVLVVDKKQAEERILSIIGSNHRVKRTKITISEIKEIPIDEATDPIIKQLVGGK